MDSAREHHKNVNLIYRLHKGFSYCAEFQNVEQHKKYGNNQAIDSVNMRPTHRVRSCVQVGYGTTEWFPVQKGVRQGSHRI